VPDRNTKYTAAWLESNMRITARETILSGFIALASTLVGASLAAQRDSPVVFISAVVGYIALAATILTRHHDLIVGELNKFQYEISLKDPNDLKPEWFDPDPKGSNLEGYYERVLGHRLKRDVAQIMFILLAGVSALVVSRAAIKRAPICSLRSLMWYGSGLCLAISIALVAETAYRRKHFFKQMLDLKRKSEQPQQTPGAS